MTVGIPALRCFRFVTRGLEPKNTFVATELFDLPRAEIGWPVGIKCVVHGFVPASSFLAAGRGVIVRPQWLRHSPRTHQDQPGDTERIWGLVLTRVSDRHGPFVPGSAECIASIHMHLVLLTAEQARSFYRYLPLLERVSLSLFVCATSCFFHQLLHPDTSIQQRIFGVQMKVNERVGGHYL